MAIVEQRKQRGGKSLATVGHTVVYVVWLALGTGVSYSSSQEKVTEHWWHSVAAYDLEPD